MFRTFNKINIKSNLTTLSIRNYNYIGKISFDSRLYYFTKQFTPIKSLTSHLETVNSKKDYLTLYNYLEEVNNKKTDTDIYNIKSFIYKNYSEINFNQYNYYKYPFLKTPFITAYLIIWNINAETNIHFHPSNGCYILKLCGKWKETIYKSDIEYERILKEGETCFINNEIGSHKVRFIPDCSNDLGISLNIYSPSDEIE
jgi:hypothetical protein